MRQIREKLMEELRSLEKELRVELPREIRAALGMGDLRENAEYQAALERQGYVRARIAQLRSRLSALGTVNLAQIPRDRVGIGSTVILRDMDSNEQLTYDLVLPELADLEQGLVSVASPVGRGLVGSRDGDQVTIRVPSGLKRYEVVSFRTLLDKEEEAGAGAGEAGPAS